MPCRVVCTALCRRRACQGKYGRRRRQGSYPKRTRGEGGGGLVKLCSKKCRHENADELCVEKAHANSYQVQDTVLHPEKCVFLCAVPDTMGTIADITCGCFGNIRIMITAPSPVRFWRAGHHPSMYHYSRRVLYTLNLSPQGQG